MTVRGTENYVYYTDVVLGSGSTATVFFGRHKRKGDGYALKVFKDDTQKKIKVKINELEYMKKLSHPNVVLCLAVENDSRSGETALIMENCTDGSVQKMLTLPEFLLGFPELLFVNFIGQLSAGLHYLRLHGISHRDVKPGNILCKREDDGTRTFKLTDFGASRDLLVEEDPANPGGQPKILYGTEEYLYPPIYKTVFITKDNVFSDDYDTYGELWAIGATLYTVITGRIPFQPFHGRQNKEIMYEMISNKPCGAISAVQRSVNAQIEYKNELPPHCNISHGLKCKVVPLIATLMEKDPERQTQFDKYFPMSNNIQKSCCIPILHITRGIFIMCYIPPNKCYEDLLGDAFHQMKCIYPQDVEGGPPQLFLGNCKLLDVVGNKTTVFKYPDISEINPVLLLPNEKRMKTFVPEEISTNFCMIDIPIYESSNDRGNEALYAREVCSYTLRAKEMIEYCVKIQRNVTGIRETLIMTKVCDMETHRNIFTTLLEFYFQLDSSSILLSAKVKLLLSNMEKGVGETSTTSTTSTTASQLKLFTKRYKKKMSEIFTLLNEANVQKVKIENFIAKELDGARDSVVLLYPSYSPCKENCIERISIQYESFHKIYQQFLIDKKKDDLNYNQLQIHKFEKITMEKNLRSVANIIKEHCNITTIRLQQEFLSWYHENFLSFAEIVQSLKKEIEKFNGILHSISINLEKLKKDCDEARTMIGPHLIRTLDMWKDDTISTVTPLTKLKHYKEIIKEFEIAKQTLKDLQDSQDVTRRLLNS